MAVPYIETDLPTLSEPPGVGDLGTPTFDEKAFPHIAGWTTVYNSFNGLKVEYNAALAWMNTTMETTEGYMTTTLGYKNDAETARDLAFGTANYLGEWSEGSYDRGQTVSIGGKMYASKIDGNTDTPPSTNWQPVDTRAIDSYLKDVSVTSYDYTDGELTSETYTTGNKALYSYAGGDLTKEEYTDTDGLTVLLTITHNYDADGDLTSSIRS
jgi:hypothetical protein